MRKTDSMVTLQFILLINELLYKNNASISACMIIYKLGKFVKLSFSTRWPEECSRREVREMVLKDQAQISISTSPQADN